MNVVLTGSAEGTIEEIAKEQGWTEAKALAFMIDFYQRRANYMESDDFEGAPEPEDVGVLYVSA